MEGEEGRGANYSEAAERGEGDGMNSLMSYLWSWLRVGGFLVSALQCSSPYRHIFIYDRDSTISPGA